MEDCATRGSGNERGAALVEFALVLPLLLMLLIGIATAGIAYNHKLSLTHAAREAGRFGATLPLSAITDPDLSRPPDVTDLWLDEVASRVVEDAAGTLGPGTPGLYICVALVDGVGSSMRKRIETGAGSPTAPYPGDWCFDDKRYPPNSPKPERRVQVEVRRDVEINVVVWKTTVTITSQAVNRFEAAPGN